jgi:hypothetical protein
MWNIIQQLATFLCSALDVSLLVYNRCNVEYDSLVK